MGSALTVSNLSKSYGSFRLHIDELHLDRGATVMIVGKNGAGKTTFLETLLNVRTRDAGTIEILGQDNIACECEIKQRMGFVIDESGFYEKLTLAEAGRVMAKIYQTWDQAAFEDALCRFGLDGRQRFSELSRGMLVKGKLALATAHGPELLVLDEITSGIDPFQRRDLLGYIEEYLVADPGRTLLFSTHLIEDAEVLPGEVYLMDSGRLAKTTAQEVRDLIDAEG